MKFINEKLILSPFNKWGRNGKAYITVDQNAILDTLANPFFTFLLMPSSYIK